MAHIESPSTGQKQEVDAGSLSSRSILYGTTSKIARKHREKIDANTQEALIVAGKNEDFTTILRTDRKGNLIVGNNIPDLIEFFEGATMNVQKWTVASTGMTPAQTTGNGYIVNNTAVTTINAVSILQSTRFFYKFSNTSLQLRARMRVNIYTNSVADCGWGVPATTTLIVPNGISVRCVNGLWTAAITSNNAELIATNIVDFATGLVQLDTSSIAAEFYLVDAIINDNTLTVTVQNTQTGDMVGYANLAVPFSALKMFAATALPVYFRLYNAAVAPSTAPNFTIGEVSVSYTDCNISQDASQLSSSLSLTAGRHPFSGAQLCNHTNSVAPVSGTLSNVTPSYTTLGGRYQFVTVAGAITDYVLFAFQVPANSRFICTGVSISARNEGAIVATTPTILEWSMGFNSTGGSLATSNIIRVPIPSNHVFPIGAAIGTGVDVAREVFPEGEVTESGRFIQVILTLPTSTATLSQIIRGQVLIKGRFL
jgi:hypothetical protein